MPATKRVNFDQTTAATHVAVTKPEGSKHIRVKEVHLISAGNVNLTFQDGAGTKLAGLYALAAQAAISLPHTTGDNFHFRAADGESLDIVLSGAVQVGGFIVYEVFG
jgi:ribosomal protein S4E